MLLKTVPIKRRKCFLNNTFLQYFLLHYVIKYDILYIKKLRKGEYDMPRLDDVMTCEEAAQRWGKSTITVRKACSPNRGYPPRFYVGAECRKSQFVWLVTRKGMERLWGKEPTTSEKSEKNA